MQKPYTKSILLDDKAYSKIKTLTTNMLLLLTGLLAAISLGPLSPVSAGDFDSWSYSSTLNIDNAANGQQMKIVVGYSSGGDYNCSGNCLANFSDIRFGDVDDDSGIDYYMVNYTASTQATFYVELPSDASSDNSIKMYWGKSGVGTTSNGDNTFVFFDDFEDNDLTEWTSSGADVSVSSSKAKHGSYSVFIEGQNDWPGVRLKKNLSANNINNCIVHCSAYVDSITTSKTVNPIKIITDESATDEIGIVQFAAPSEVRYDAMAHEDPYSFTFNNDIWYEFEAHINFTDSKIYLYLNGYYADQVTFCNPSQVNYTTDNTIYEFWLDGNADTSTDVYYDDYWIMNLSSPMPSWNGTISDGEPASDFTLSGLDANGRITWSGEGGQTVWSNASLSNGKGGTLVCNITANSTDNITEMRLYADDLGGDVDASNITVYVSATNESYAILDYNSGKFPENGGNITVNATTWPDSGAGTCPLPINDETDFIYFRFTLSIPSSETSSTTYTQDDWLDYYLSEEV